jgi:hypothetical protein
MPNKRGRSNQAKTNKKIIPLSALFILTLMGIVSATLLSQVTITITGVTPPTVETKPISGQVNPGESGSDIVLTKRLNVTGVAQASYKIKVRVVLQNVESLKTVFDYFSVNVTAFTDASYTTRAGGYPKDTGLLGFHTSEIVLYLTGSTDYYMVLWISYNARTDIGAGTSVTVRLLAEVVDIQGAFVS